MYFSGCRWSRLPRRHCPPLGARESTDWVSRQIVTYSNGMQMTTDITIQSHETIHCANGRKNKFFQSQDRYQTNINANTLECEINLFGGLPQLLIGTYDSRPIQDVTVSRSLNRIRLKIKYEWSHSEKMCWFMQSDVYYCYVGATFNSLTSGSGLTYAHAFDSGLLFSCKL